ncbi:MAG TPA: patatin-like phospholipase family protein [Azospirillum sp.]|nr:patatin-like phospholipase family protein [Azospirillum sp.]
MERLCLRRVFAGCLAMALGMLLSGCAMPERSTAVPRELQDRATVLGRSDLRYWVDRSSDTFLDAALASLQRERATLAAAGHGDKLPTANFLAISGGGEDGAFGAGLLVGWTASGTRPELKGVTGVSTGALTAPFAFLGPAYDAQLKEVYTTISGKDVLQPRGYLAALLNDAMADNTPLRHLVSRYVDQRMLEAIAAEHAKGRVLLIATTNLDARRPVIWNVGAIAASGHPGALRLVHDLLVASAAIPGAFPPMMIETEVDGQRYQEMHVDGGTSAQVFLYPPSLDIHHGDREYGIKRERQLFVIRNARLDPDWAEVRRRTLEIATRSVSSLIQTQGVGDLYRIFIAAQRDGIDFNLAYIPETFTTELKEPFDTAYMNDLFNLGYALGSKGYQWAKTPPGYAAPKIEPPVPPTRRATAESGR